LATVILPDDEALNLIRAIFGQSVPGANLHSLLLAREDTNGLGLPAPVTEVIALAPAYDNALPVDGFVADAIRRCAHQPGKPAPLLAALVMENVMVPKDVDDAAKALAAQLSRQGRLQEHPAALEITMLYAATADGRRFSGCQWLTGPRATQMEGPTVWARGTRGPQDRWPHAHLIRAAVGLRW
jgi:hypothetical protein